MQKNNRLDSGEISDCSHHLLKSESIVILAADSALAAVRAHFTAHMEDDYWEAVKYQRAALETALASLVNIQ
ncbi:hypothetical protein AB7W40_23155 [Providencia rettgeri]